MTEQAGNTLGNWIMRYNSFRKVYEGVKRENYNELFSGDNGNVLRATTIDTLQEIIIKTDGNKDKIEKLLRNGK